MANVNINTTLSTTATSTPATHANKTYYDKLLLEVAKTKFKHAQYGQKRTVPKNGGKSVEYRKMELFDVSTTPLVDGVVPDGQKLAQSKVEATLAQYGAYVTTSDFFEDTNYDRVQNEVAELLGEQLGTALEWVARDAMCDTGTNVIYADSNTSRIDLEAADKLTVTDVRKAVRTLKKAKAKMFSRNGRDHFICICSPDAVYDLQGDADWKDVSKYSNAEQIYTGEIGQLFGVVFVESTEAKVIEEPFIEAVNAATTTSADFVLKGTPSAAAIAHVSVPGAKIYIANTAYTLDGTTPYTAVSSTVKLSATASLAKDAIVTAGVAGKNGVDIHQTLIFGKDAYGIITLDGGGDIEYIVKPRGSSGAADPLNQIATIGAKVNGFTAKILQPLWIIRIEHGVTA